ncbi:MAG: energy transducer TonB [Flavobacteriia bacterium]|nr:energy transducer TonB [Flavobacteriia bacterium]
MTLSFSKVSILFFVLLSGLASAQMCPGGGIFAPPPSSDELDESDMIEEVEEIEGGRKYEFTQVTEFPIAEACESAASRDEQWSCTVYQIQRHIASNFVFPEDARSGPGGRVIINFEINAKGQVVNVCIVKSSGIESIDEAGIIAVASLDDFQPARLNGRTVRMTYNVPINASTGNDE